MAHHLPFYKKPVLLIPLSMALFLGAILRLALPGIILKQTNDELSQISPNIGLEIEELELQVFRGEYTMRKVKAHLKQTGETFLTINRINFQTNWKNVWQGELIARIYADGLKLTLSNEVIENLKFEKEHVHQALTNSHFEIRKIFLSDSHVYFKNFDHAIHDLNLEVEKMKRFILTASVFGPSPARIVGNIEIKKIPLEWNVDAEMRDFDLTTIQQLLKEHWNMSVTQGSMDLYAEIQSIGEEVFGYLKPFITGLKMADPTQQLDLDSERTVASKIPIGFKTKFKLMNFLKRGVENRIGPENENLKQAEEAR